MPSSQAVVFITSLLGNPRRDNQAPFAQPGGGPEKRIGSSFYRGDAINFHPQSGDYAKEEFLEEDGRHLATDVIPTIMAIFESVYCASGVTRKSVSEKFRQTHVRNVASLDPEDLEKRATRRMRKIERTGSEIDESAQTERSERRARRRARRTENLDARDDPQG
jgi:hypothetical protein